MTDLEAIRSLIAASVCYLTGYGFLYIGFELKQWIGAAASGIFLLVCFAFWLLGLFYFLGALA